MEILSKTFNSYEDHKTTVTKLTNNFLFLLQYLYFFYFIVKATSQKCSVKC